MIYKFIFFQLRIINKQAVYIHDYTYTYYLSKAITFSFFQTKHWMHYDSSLISFIVRLNHTINYLKCKANNLLYFSIRVDNIAAIHPTSTYMDALTVS